MTRYTLSSLINALIRFEEAVANKLNEFIESMDNDSLNKFVSSYRNRIRRLAVYKETMIVEMILEPITGIDIDEKIINITVGVGGQEPYQCVRRIIETYIDVYRDVSKRIYGISIDVSMLLNNFVREARRLLQSLE